MTARIYYFTPPITELERRGGCLLRVPPVVFEDMDPPPQAAAPSTAPPDSTSSGETPEDSAPS